MLAGGSASEVFPGEKDLCARVPGIVQDEGGVCLQSFGSSVGGGIFVAPVVKECYSQPCAAYGLQKLLGDDGIGIDIGAVDGGDQSVEGDKGIHEKLLVRVSGPGKSPVVGKVASDSGGGRHLRADEMCSPVLSLASFKVSVRGRGAALEGGQLVGVHADAHGAPRLTPLETGLDKDGMESLLFRLGPHESRAGHNHGGDAPGHLSALHNHGGCPEILNASVCAGADEDAGDGDLRDRRSRDEPHVRQSLSGRIPDDRVREALRIGNPTVDTGDLAWVGSPCDLGGEGGDVDCDGTVVWGLRVGGKCLPESDGLFPKLSLGSVGTTLDIGKSNIIRSNHSGSGTGLDGHVAEGHSSFHREGPDGLSGELNDVACAPGGPDLADDGEDEILGSDSFGGMSLDLDLHRPGTGLGKGLGGQDMLHFGGADPEAQRSEGAVGGRMAVAADDGLSGKADPLFGGSDVDNSLPLVVHRKVSDPELAGIFGQCLYLEGAFGVGDAASAVGGWHIVVGNGKCKLGTAHLSSGHPESFKGLGARDLVDQVAIDIEKGGSIFIRYRVVVPYLVDDCSGHDDLLNLCYGLLPRRRILRLQLSLEV